VDDDAVRPGRRELRDDSLVGDVAPHEHRLGAGLFHQRDSLFRCLVVAHVSEHRAGRTVGHEPERDRPPDPPGSPGDEHRGTFEAHRRGSGSSAGAELGSSLQPGRVRGSRWLSAAFEDAWPSRSSSSIFSSA
jgi:hypothetical protein